MAIEYQKSVRQNSMVTGFNSWHRYWPRYAGCWGILQSSQQHVTAMVSGADAPTVSRWLPVHRISLMILMSSLTESMVQNEHRMEWQWCKRGSVNFGNQALSNLPCRAILPDEKIKAVKSGAGDHRGRWIYRWRIDKYCLVNLSFVGFPIFARMRSGGSPQWAKCTNQDLIGETEIQFPLKPPVMWYRGTFLCGPHGDPHLQESWRKCLHIKFISFREDFVVKGQSGFSQNREFRLRILQNSTGKNG